MLGFANSAGVAPLLFLVPSSSASYERRLENLRVVPIVITELELRNVERQILLADLVERANHAALNQRPEAFNRVGVDCTNDILTDGVVNDGVRIILYDLPRCVTVREMARLHGFPDWFRFHATKWHGARQIGNAVPPPLARTFAGALMMTLGIEPTRPPEQIALGDPALIRMGMSEASGHFGIEKPIGRRDRKSGATKRKQHEIEEGRTRQWASHG